MADDKPDVKPTASSIGDHAKRMGVSVPYVYAAAKKQRDYDAAVSRGEKPEGPSADRRAHRQNRPAQQDPGSRRAGLSRRAPTAT